MLVVRKNATAKGSKNIMVSGRSKVTVVLPVGANTLIPFEAPVTVARNKNVGTLVAVFLLAVALVIVALELAFRNIVSEVAMRGLSGIKG